MSIGDTATFDFILTNKKSVDMTLTVVTFSTGEFNETTNAQGKIITAKGTLLITVRFTPALPGGNKTDTMHLQWTDVNGKSGTKDVKLSGEAVPVPIMQCPTTLDMGTVGIGQTGTTNFNIENTGTADLVLSLFNFNGNATLFSITAGGTVPVTVIPGATHAVTVQFAPTATGSFPTVLEISHNAVNIATPATINISAQGGGGRIELNQTSPWDIGAARTGSSITDVVEISNTGSINLNIQSITLVTGNVFTIDSVEDSSGNPITAPFAIPVGDFVEVTIKLSPTTIQQYQDTLEIANDGSYAPSPATLALEGEGRGPISQTFNYTGAAQNWNIPAGVAQIDVDAYGAEGGNGQRGTTLTQFAGKGGRVQASISITPGGTLNIYVGERGTDARIGASGGGAGGWNGGGLGATYSTGGGGGGGGATDIREGGTALTNRIIVAGAGGGSGCNYSTGDAGGVGGGLTGGTGYSMNPASYNGYGGTQTAGGLHGGALGIGGPGGDYPTPRSQTGGGGGGGYYGGGGSTWMGAGGGSSFTHTRATNVIHTQGVHDGNGEIVISY